VPFGYAAPAELRLTLLSNATPFELRTPFWAAPHPTALRRTQLCYAASFELHRTLLSYADSYWATELLSLPFSKPTHYQPEVRRIHSATLKGHCHEIFCFWFISWISFPKPLIIPLGPFQNLLKIRGDIRSSRFATGGVVELAYRIFFFNFIISCQQFDNCSHCLPPVSTTPVANLPQVSTTLAKMVEKFAACVVDTGAVVHLELRIFLRICKKIPNGLNVILWGWGETDS
jgi:hypothetical protein